MSLGELYSPWRLGDDSPVRWTRNINADSCNLREFKVVPGYKGDFSSRLTYVFLFISQHLPNFTDTGMLEKHCRFRVTPSSQMDLSDYFLRLHFSQCLFIRACCGIASKKIIKSKKSRIVQRRTRSLWQIKTKTSSSTQLPY